MPHAKCAERMGKVSGVIMDIIIRPARPLEAGQLTELSLRSKQSNDYNDEFMDACREELTVTPERIEGNEYWVAEADHICGCACLSRSTVDHSGEVHAFFIEPAHQRQGIGTLLWDALLQRVQQRGLTQLFLDADPFATAFYESLGFEKICETPSGPIAKRMIPRMRLIIDKVR